MRDLVARLRQGNASTELVEAFHELGDWLFAQSITELLALPRSRSGPTWEVPPAEAADLARRFHASAGTLTPQVAQSLEGLALGRDCVRAAHQPNFAAYLKAFAVFLIAEEAAALTDSVPVYVINDCDVIGNRRFAHTLLPDFTHPLGIRHLRLSTSGMSSSCIAYRSPRPSKQWLDSTVALITANHESEFRLAKVRPATGSVPLADVIDDLVFAWQRSRTMSEMTSILLSRLVNVRLGKSLLFLPGHQLWQRIGPQVVEFLFTDWRRVREAQDKVARRLSRAGLDQFRGFTMSWLTDSTLVPLWWVCSCGSRVRLDFSASWTTCRGTCELCTEDVALDRSRVSDEITSGRLLPRVGVLDWAEGMSIQARAGVSHIGSGPHSLIYALVSRELGAVELPQAFLDIHGEFGTPAERVSRWDKRPRSAVGAGGAANVVSAGRASVIYYLTRLDVSQLQGAIKGWVRTSTMDDPLTLP